MGKSKNNALTRRGQTDVGIILQTINGSASHQQRKHRMGTKFMPTYTGQISKRVNQMITWVSHMSVQISNISIRVNHRCSARSNITKAGCHSSWVMMSTYLIHCVYDGIQYQLQVDCCFHYQPTSYHYHQLHYYYHLNHYYYLWRPDDAFRDHVPNNDKTEHNRVTLEYKR